MMYLFKLARRTARLRALPLIGLGLAVAGCDGEHLTNSTEPEATPSAETPTALFSVGFRGGIPFGTWALPTSWFGDTYNGAVRNIGPGELLSELAAIKARGGRVILAMAGNESNFRDGQGHFDLAMWKDRIDRFRSVNFDSYIEDGTVMGHYVIDEPNDPHNWGAPIPGQTLETMAAYSKQIWPKMATIIRVEPKYLAQYGNIYHNLDAAWAQWVSNRGDAADYIQGQVSIAQNLGLMLVTGVNISLGISGQYEVPANTLLSVGSALLANSYPCAFISWTFDQNYLTRADIRNTMATLSQKAESHANRSCLKGGSSGGGGDPPPPLPGINGIVLSATKALVSGDQVVRLAWQGAAGTSVRLFVNGAYRRTTANDGQGTAYPHRAGQYSYKICEVNSTRCSNSVAVTIK
jgi:hypothetical protein